MSSRKRKHGIFTVDSEAVKILQTQEVQKKHRVKAIDEAIETVSNQMRIAGNRSNTIDSYKYIFMKFVAANDFKYVEEINIDSIYYYLDSPDVSPSTKLFV